MGIVIKFPAVKRNRLYTAVEIADMMQFMEPLEARRLADTIKASGAISSRDLCSSKLGEAIRHSWIWSNYMPWRIRK